MFREGLTFSSRYVVIYARPNELNFSRLGLSVSKKIGTAVTRNRVKRLLREAVRESLKGAPLKCDFIIVAKKSSVEGGLHDFIQDIKRFMIKIAEVNTVSLRGVPKYRDDEAISKGEIPRPPLADSE